MYGRRPRQGIIGRIFHLLQSSGRLAGLLLSGIALVMPILARPDAIDDALAAPDRPAADRERDVHSNPAGVLRFVGLPAGGVVVDLFAGGGYYSEIVTRTLGPDATVYMHNNDAYLSFAGDAVEERLADGRLPNVVRYDRELDAIDLADDSVDLVLMVMTYHDLYYKTDGWDLDPDGFFAMLHRILKPGGVLAVVDHVALPGTGSGAAQDLHRIDPAYARQDIEGHGFVFSGQSEILLKADDPLDISVFDSAIRGRTSKFLYKFVEPQR